MSRPGTNGATTPGVFFPPSPCPPDAPCASTVGTTESLTQQDRYKRGRLDPDLWENSEAAILIEAASRASVEVTDAQPRIDAALVKLAKCVAHANGRLADLAAFVSGRQFADAHDAMRTLVSRHAHDGPEDRRRRSRWVLLLTWPTVIATAGYDTWFFSGVFRRLLDASTRWNDPGLWISLLPGVMITVALLVTAHWIAQASGRANDHIERRPEWTRWWSRFVGFVRRRSPKKAHRSEDGLPWPRWVRAVAFGAFTLVTLGLWAAIRGVTALQNENNPDAPDVQTPPGAVALLLLLFSIAAVAIKVLHHNPFAASDREIRARMTMAEDRRAELLRSTEATLAAQEGAMTEANMLLGELTERARLRLDEALASVLRGRATHGLAGDQAPRFTKASTDDGGIGPTLFEGMVEPPVNLRPVHRAVDVLKRYDLAAARETATKLKQDLLKQIDVVEVTAAT